MGSDNLPLGMRVLICDDEALTVMQVTKALKRAGFTVADACNTGADAVRCAKELRPDVILMDVQMPGMSGIEAARQIMMDAPACIIMLTAFSDERHILESFEAGAAGYVVKPIDGASVIQVIAAALERYRAPGMRADIGESRAIEQARTLRMARKRTTDESRGH